MRRQSGAASSRWPETSTDAGDRHHDQQGQLLLVWCPDAAHHQCRSVPKRYQRLAHQHLQYDVIKMGSFTAKWDHNALLQARLKEDLPQKEENKHHRRQHEDSEWSMFDLVAEEMLTEGELGLFNF
jgi:hypothetical protein